MLSLITRQHLCSFPSALRGTQLIVKKSVTSSAVTIEDETKVVIAEDGKTLVCWHPEPKFPYEHTKPLPNVIATDKHIIKALDDVDQFKGLKEEFVREQLMKMTYTTKHRWFPRPQKKKAKKSPMDRPFL